MASRILHEIIDGIEYKWCGTCGNWKELCLFYSSKEKWDGLRLPCKSCGEYKNKQHNREYYREHKHILNPKKVRYARERCSYDIKFKISKNLRSRLRYALRSSRVHKFSSALNLVGCDFDELKMHIESKFDANMNWENYGTYWHIDHIRPCASFNLSDIEQQKQCFHYTNLQPLEKYENLSKQDKF